MDGRTALVLGASGGIGGEVAARLAMADWHVRGLVRDPARVDRALPLEWIAGDALAADDVRRAARGADLIVHAVNPAGYRNWSRLVLPMINNTIAAAAETRARILLPGTVYNYGPDALDAPQETSPQNPVTRKGRIRAELERRLEVAAYNGRARVLIVRSGDYFGPRARNNWFGQVMVTPGRRPKAITYPGRTGVGHQWAYIPDVAETMVRLAERDGLDDFAAFHMEGHWDADGTRMVEAIRSVLGDPDLPVKKLPWRLMRLASPAVPLFREIGEIRYLWERPVRLTNDRLVATLGAEPRTPLPDAVRASLRGLGCLEPAAADAVRAVSAA
ncbi:NAD-dependent epimerase/dehydratase family protein [Amorphus orientalis]|uniref:Nucleoside-diphosphate-sugar epimerase n=1 Tax=Amorphus orientalis TaxID=649198 RepID=A0AAE3VPH8_9HYPH|nr:NAD-dependent epimerase/dehydratase family protein [Amorphus orientalis]MDQ0315648.1 nucleoside-diphosphate-sugar epimerase [Amorphus orientalis]